MHARTFECRFRFDKPLNRSDRHIALQSLVIPAPIMVVAPAGPAPRVCSRLHLSGLHGGLIPQTLQISRDRCDSEDAAITFIGHSAVTGLETTFDLNLVPALGVPHVVEHGVVVLAPKERHGVEFFTATEDVPGRY